ncbi:MAG: UrcA family protein [Hyphomonadaceae bacterium]
MIAAGFALMASAGVAAAQGQDAPAQAISVNYEDLDLNRTEDAASLLSRLRYAAMRACEVDAMQRPGPAARRAINECRNAALEQAVADANEPELARLYAERQR